MQLPELQILPDAQSDVTVQTHAPLLHTPFPLQLTLAQGSTIQAPFEQISPDVQSESTVHGPHWLLLQTSPELQSELTLHPKTQLPELQMYPDAHSELMLQTQFPLLQTPFPLQLTLAHGSLITTQILFLQTSK